MYLIQTVQTSWRPQLPLPTKEPDADSSSTTDEQDVNDMEQRAQHQHVNSCKDNNSLNATHTSSMNHTPASATKKWSFGRLFRRKKDIASDSSSEEDRKAGFTPTHRNSRATSGSSANLKTKLNKTNKLSRSSKFNGASFDHIVLHPQTGAPITPPHPPLPHVDNEFFLPVETISPSGAYYQNQQQYLQQGAQAASAYTRSANSLDRRAAHAVYKTRSAQRLPHDSAMLGAPPRSSSEEEIISLNSSTFSKYRSDESIHSGGQANNMQSKRSRAARNERYYKRLSRDGEPSTGQVPLKYAPQQTQRWKTQPVPLSIYNPSAAQVALAHNPQTATPRLRNTSSLQHVAPYVQWGQLQQQQQQQQQQSKNLQNSMNEAKRSISYDSHIHLQNINGRLQTKPLPPPPPPRDPLRRVNVSGQMQNGSSAGDLRPISYAFDQSGLPLVPSTNRRLGNRCVSDDKIWSGPAGPHYQSVHSLNTPLVSAQHEKQQAAHQAGDTPHHRRFITRAERDAHPGKKSLPNGLEFHYVADATPRSRKPIHMIEPQYDGAGKEESGAGILRTTKSGLASPSTPRGANDFWQRMDTNVAQQQRGRTTHAAEVHAYPRSISSSRVGELRAYPIPLYSEVQKPKREPQASPFSASGVDEVDNIVCGSLHIKSKPDTANANYVEIRNKDYSKSNSMPNQYQRRSGEIPNTPNKYDEYVAEKREQHHKPIYGTPTPPQRKLSITPSKAPELPIYLPRKKPANLEEAINELEAIYKSLGLTEPEPEPEKKQRVPTPSEFEKYALARAAEFDYDEDSPAGEPDPIRDDVAYRNMQLANLQHKTAEKQPPFGIPVGPVVAAPHTDYLHVTPIVEPPHRHAPDIVKDDLAVRALRKDPPGPKDKFNYPYSSFQQQKKNRATRTQSANIYNLIHRDAAKPSGGDLHSYLELTRNLERAGSMSDLHHKGDKDIGVRASDVPATLALLRNLKEQEQELATPAKKAPIPFRHPSQGGAICALPEKLPSHSAMNKQEVHKPPVPLPRKSLTPEPTAVNAQMEDALNKIAKEAQEKSMKLTKELQELRKEALITSARSKASANAKMNSTEEERLEQDLQEIEAVSEAAKRCGKMLLDTLPDTNEPHVQAKPRKLQKEGKLIEAIDQVSEAANAVCEKILKDIVTTEPPVVLQEAVKVKNKQSATTAMPEALVTPNLIKKLDPIQSEKIEAIAKRCMRQLSELAEDNPDYDNLNQELKERQQEQEEREQSNAAISAAHGKAANSCNAVHIQTQKVDNSVSTVPEAARTQTAAVKSKQNVEEIDQIMQECEAKMRAGSTYTPTVAPPPLPLPAPVVNAKLVAMRHLSSSDDHTTAPSIATTTNSSCSSAAAGSVAGKTGASTTASSFSSSSDCLAKSSSPSAGRRQSSSITSFNPYSSSDYIKSPTSSDYHTPSTDPIKTFSTTSYDVQTTTSAATPNISATTNSTFSYTPSPPPPPKLILMVDNESAGVARSGADSVGSDASCGAVVSHTAIATRQSQERQRARSLSTPSQYNSSEELAMIFGIDEQTCRLRSAPQATSEAPPLNVTESVDTTHFVNTNNTTNNENQSSNCSLSSISATAKSNCQPTSKNYDKTKQLQQTQELQRKRIQEKKELQQLHTKSKQQPTVGTNKPTTRYHGVYPHFHHHTAPAYYTDVNLHIHTPKANDVAALNENYQSVYNTPSQLINEHYFPKTSTATVVPPPIGTGTAIIGRANTTSPTSGGDKRDRERERHYYQTTKQQQKIAAPATTKHSLTKATARAAFFRGGSVGNKERKRCEPFVQTTSPAAFGRAAKKGDFLNLNDTKTSYDDITSSHDANTSCDNITDDSSFVACDINETSSECSKIKHLVNKIDTSYINNTNKNNHIPITSPTSTGNTSAGGAASPTGVGNTSTSTGRSHHSNRFAGKKRAVRVRSESRPISALYDIICKEKGLDIGTSATSDENSLSAASNDIENYSGGANTNANQNDGKRNNKQKRRNRSSKERSRSQRSNSRHDSLNTHNDYSEISNCLNAFVANSIATYLGEEGAAGDLAEAILLNTSINPYDMDKNASDRTKRAHKTRTASSQKSVSSKKRKDHGKTSKMQTQTRNSNNTERYAASDDELNGATAESSGDAGARTKSSSARTKYRTIASDGRRHAVKTNGLDKASSLPPRLYGGAHITSPSFCDQEQKHTASCYLNVNGADAYTYAMHKKCPVHCGCQLEKSSSNSIGDRCSSLKHDQNEYHHQAQSLSLPPLPSSPPLNLSLNAGPPSSASCMRSSPITAEDNSSIVAAVDSRISPVKFYVEPINMTLSGMSSGTSPSASAAGTAISAKGSVLNNKNANSSSSGVVVTEPTSNSNSSRCNHQRISRAQQRRFREELGRFTDLPQLDLLSPRESEVERAVLSEDEGVVAVVKEGKGRSSKTRRFINRPSRTPSRGRTGNSVNGSPHPSRRGSTHQHNYRSESSESSSTPSSSPPASNGCCASTTNNNRRISSAPTTTSPPPQPVSAFDIGGYSVPVSNISLAGITIEDVGSASSSADHISTLIKLSPLDIMTNSATPATELRPPAHGGVAGAETELNCAASGASNGEVQVAIADKKKCEEDAALYQRSRSPTSPRPPTLSPKYQSPRPSTSSSSDNARDSKLSAISASLPKQPQPAANGGHKSTTSSVDSPKASKKPIPSISVSVKQNLSEMHYNGDIKSPSSPRKVILVKPKKQRDPLSLDTECTAKFTHSAGRLSTSDISDANLVYSKNGKPLPCPRTTITVKTNKTTTSNEVKSSGGDETSSTQQERSSVNGATPDSSMEERDKSSKRKSNLNRSFNDEATVDSDDSLAARRRRRRELGMVRQLVPSDDAVVREMLLAHQNKPADTNKSTADAKSAQNDLAYHMEIARRGWDLFTTSAIRARSETGSPKYEVCTKEVTKAKSSHARLPRRSDTLHLGELRKLRSNDVNRKVNERTKSDLAEIKKIAEQANVETAMMASGIATELAEQAVQLVDLMSEANGLDPNECFVELPTPPRYGLGCRDKLPPPAPSYAELEVAAEAKERDSLPAKHATFVQEEPIYYDPEKSDQLAKSVSNTSMASGLLRQRMLKARSMERDAGHEPPKLSPILRRRSTDDPAYITIPTTSSSSLHSTSPLATSHNHIVSILKKKDHIAGESSSASSNASPVTFSANVVDTPTTKYKRAGILKKRSSLDESRYYSRSHSPDERSILIKSARRNSLEEIAGLQQQQQQHGILKQSSYESSKSDGCPSATEPHPHGILKKKDSTSTPSDGGTHAPKHVSISQAVKMAAAELGHEAADSQYATAADHDESGYTPNNEEYEIRPILKLESTSSDDAMRPPKPILKKKSSGDSDEYEIRPILKTSRKSSREEFDLGGSLSEDGRHHSEQTQLIPPVRPILKTDSPSKRRSLGGAGTDWLDDQDVFNDAENARESALSLKRRTRSLDRQETPVVDLAEALNAIATSQAAPVEFVSTPITTGGSISVAERIRNMEKFLNSAGNSPTSVADGNSSWDSPLQSGVSPRLLKPSAIKRDMYRDRYKTQPVTNDEKMLFKVNASPLDTSSTSAFKPAKSLDAGLNYTTFAHLNAPSAASSHTPGSTYTLTRCATQPVHPQQYQCNQFNAGIGAETVATSTPPLRQLNSVSDTTTTPTTNSYNNSNSISEQLTLSLGSDSERIFEMSGINDSSLLATSEGVQSQPEGSGSVVGSGGLSRQNSVRARANMFQKIHEKKKSVEGAASTAAGLSREGQTSPRRALPQFSPTSAMLSTPPIMSSSLNSNDEPNTTPQNPPRTDEEIATSRSPTTKSAFLPPPTVKGILKSKSGCVGFMPMDLSSELKNRLKSSTHASVSNLRKSATTHDALFAGQSVVDKENVERPATSNARTIAAPTTATPQHDDAVSLVRNLSSLGRPPLGGAGSGGVSSGRDAAGAGGSRADTIASTSEGESSGGREISEIIKNSAVARRRKLNDGNYVTKAKTATKFWPYQLKPQPTPPLQHDQT